MSDLLCEVVASVVREPRPLVPNDQLLSLESDRLVALLPLEIVDAHGGSSATGGRWRIHNRWIDLHKLSFWRQARYRGFFEKLGHLRVVSEKPLHLRTQGTLIVASWLVPEHVWKAEVSQYGADIRELELHGAVR